MLFDETYIHYAENTSGENRLILFCDIERPMRYRWAQKVNHWLGRHLMSAASAPNDIGDRTGGINRAFRYIYQIRIVGKRLKKWNKTVYYIVKWLLFGGIASAYLERVLTPRRRFHGMVASRRAMPQKPVTPAKVSPAPTAPLSRKKAAVNGIAQQHPQ